MRSAPSLGHRDISALTFSSDGRWLASSGSNEVRVWDTRDLAAQLERLLTDPAFRESMGANAAHDARQRFNLEREADAYLGLYNSMIAAH